MRPAADWLYQLLPIVLRERDPDNGYPLRALLRIIADQAAQLEGDMWQLYDDHFIETCQPWVIPYLGDLVGNELIWDSLRAPAAETAGQLFPDLAGSPTLQPPVAARSRADVANTLRYRRRKGTSSVLEALARDVTGWFVRAVESRLLLARTEHLAHPLGSGGWVDLHAPDLAEVLESPFDAVAHSASISAMPELPRFGPRCMDIYVWRLQSYPVTNVPARAAGTHWRHTFSPLRSRAPLFRTAHPGAADTGPVEELDAPGPIRPTELARHLPDLYGTSLSVVVDGSQVPADDVEVATLEPWPDQRP
ncbi:MAG: hypothetical protein JOY61_17660, partial [Chloroflexi bacterium]|nr:hypothetical protein [Chloroflexota bacterium]